ncbi:2,6-dihydropseudooxynicotine hydrolase [Halenospora varia]|nr:2,6-dihydropseudooxynicotine hydrolase [Halenospora varia]
MRVSKALTQLLLIGLGLSAVITPRVTTNTTGNNTLPQMLQLSNDTDFNFQILRAFSLAPGGGSDIGEVLLAANGLVPGNFENFFSKFDSLANKVNARAQAIDIKRFPNSARDAWFAAASYFRGADFYLHGNWSDPRINSLWAQQTYAFNKAISTLPVPGVRKNVKADGFEVPTIFFGAENNSGHVRKRPTIIVGTGYDGNQEEIYHMIGKAAVERGYNVITYEGPGQPTPRREQNISFIPQWEKVITPIVDHLLTMPEVNGSAIVLLGYSFGGYLAPRAAAFEHRLAATICIDGIYSFSDIILGNFPTAISALVKAGNAEKVNSLLAPILADPTTSTATRWFFEQGTWAFKASSPFDLLNQTFSYDLTTPTNIVNQIQGPIFIADAQADMFGTGQGNILAGWLGEKATYHLFESVDGAGEHCALGAMNVQNAVVLDWLQDVLDGNK